MCVLQMFMGGGGSFSAGGPGKGMCSRLYETVLNVHGWARSAISFNSINTDSSLFGIHGTSSPEYAEQLAYTLTEECAKMSVADITPTEVMRARNQLKAAVFMQLESRALLMDDVGRQLLTYNSVKSAPELAQLIDAVTADDLRRVAVKMLSTKPTICAAGDLSKLPSYDQIVQKLG